MTLLNHNNNRQVIYTIVAEHEANLREGKLAIGTPIAKALLGKKKGDIVEVTVPAGVLKFEILDISIYCRAFDCKILTKNRVTKSSHPILFL